MPERWRPFPSAISVSTESPLFRKGRERMGHPSLPLSFVRNHSRTCSENGEQVTLRPAAGSTDDGPWPSPSRGRRPCLTASRISSHQRTRRSAASRKGVREQPPPSDLEEPYLRHTAHAASSSVEPC